MADYPLGPNDRLTRAAAAKALTEAGYPTSPTTLATKRLTRNETAISSDEPAFPCSRPVA